ncbi:MAG: hypothetical protein GXP55_21110, partial [Deltaproteobacteria bacterium]|nr:hypothetical protein [Deltaproteobacteria bacterium]
MSHRWIVSLATSALALGLLSPAPAAAQATCVDATGAMCLAAIGGGVDDIFSTSDGRFAPQLTFGTYVRGINGACAVGQTVNPRALDAYTCMGGSGTLTPDGAGGCTISAPHPRAAEAANSLDWLWTQVLRTRDDCSFVADGEAGFYVPWRGRIYDLGGEANRVVLFPVTDHGPLPCESFEYTVWLSNDPDARELAAAGAPDPAKWNPAVMMRAYNQGWTRNPNAAGAADATRADLGTFLRDNSDGEAVADSTVSVWALPCGLTFRYASVMAGNNGNPTAACAFHSGDDELDAVAGLNEDDTAICVDADGDGHRDAACGGSDCDDSDPIVHPGALEPCNSVRDLDCSPGASCPDGTACDDSTGICVPSCFEGGCADGFSCVSGRCVDTACTSLAEPCAAGTICRAGSCVDPCDGATCPSGEVCRGGSCVDPCAGVVCPTNQVCVARDPAATTLCGPACSCTELAVPLCAADRACDARDGTPSSGLCVDPGCETATCAAAEDCVAGGCVDRCAGVVCPLFHVCSAGACVPDACARISCPAGRICSEGACVDPCSLVTCADGEVCRSGSCEPDPCAGVSCPSGQSCLEGSCVGMAADAGVVDSGAMGD